MSFEQASYAVAEGSSVEVKVKLDPAPEQALTIPLTAANQGGATSADYGTLPAAVTFGADDTERTFTFSAVQDADNDDDESVVFGFGTTLPTGVSAGTPNQATVNITDLILVTNLNITQWDGPRISVGAVIRSEGVDIIPSRAAQQFTTGDNTAGYTLNGVKTFVEIDTGSPVPAVSIYYDREGTPGRETYALRIDGDVPNNYDDIESAESEPETSFFAAPVNATLPPLTDFWVVFRQDAELSDRDIIYNVYTTESTDEEGESGWGVADSSHRLDVTSFHSFGGWLGSRDILRIAVLGQAATDGTNLNFPTLGSPVVQGGIHVWLGETLSADTSEIMDFNGLTQVVYTYQWGHVATDGSFTAIANAMSRTYTVAATDLGKRLAVRVSFQDDDGNADTATSEPTGLVAASADDVSNAYNPPDIVGRGEVGNTISAFARSIQDPEGTPIDLETEDTPIDLETSEGYGFQWLRVDGDSETEIAGATQSWYRLAAADAGKQIGVRVSFIDIDGNPETLTSKDLLTVD